jgi:hypothetical protein
MIFFAIGFSEAYKCPPGKLYIYIYIYSHYKEMANQRLGGQLEFTVLKRTHFKIITN